MPAHFASPWILARLVLGATAAALALTAALGAIPLLGPMDLDSPPDARVLSRERRAELLGTLLGVAFRLELVAALFTVLASDRLAGSIRGAMCAYGVIHANEWGARAVAASLIASAGAAAWLAVRAVDRRLRRATLVPHLAGGALVVGLLVAADFIASTRYLFALDLDVVATCCSLSADAGGATGEVSHGIAFPTAVLAAGLLSVAASVCAAFLLAEANRVDARRTLFAGVAGITASVFAVRVVSDVVAPYTYESPAHPCAYCLLRRDAFPAGPIVLGAWSVALFASVALVALAPLVARHGEVHAAARAVAARVARTGAWAWVLVVVAGAVPIAHYGWVTGTLALFR